MNMSEEIIRKTYLCPIIGTGTREDGRRPKIATLSIDCSWFMHELKPEWCICTVVASAADHDIIALDPDVKLVAVRKLIQLSAAKLDTLKTQYPKFVAKFNTAKKCWIKFKEESGE